MVHVETVEHWWNGLVGTATRRDIWLRHNAAGPVWEIEAREDGKTAHGEFATEAKARAVLATITSGGPGTWRRLEQGRASWLTPDPPGA